MRAVEISGADHQTIVWKAAVVGEILDWLDAAFGIERPSREVPGDPRAPLLAVLGIALILLLPGLGLLVGRLGILSHVRPLAPPERSSLYAFGEWQART